MVGEQLKRTLTGALDECRARWYEHPITVAKTNNKAIHARAVARNGSSSAGPGDSAATVFRVLTMLTIRGWDVHGNSGDDDSGNASSWRAHATPSTRQHTSNYLQRRHGARQGNNKEATLAVTGCSSAHDV